MIDFQNKDRILPSALILIAIVIMAGATIFDLLTPTPGGPQTGHNHTMARRRLADDIFDAKMSEAKAKTALAPKLWKGNPDSVSSGVLAQITGEANKNSLALAAFRPQRSVDLGVVTELPYTVQISGPYPGIRAVLAAIDGKNSKVVLRSVQIASSEQSSNIVSATIGVSAYLAASPILTSGPTEPAVLNRSESHTASVPHANGAAKVARHPAGARATTEEREAHG